MAHWDDDDEVRLAEAILMSQLRLERAADQMLAGTRDGGIHGGRELKRMLKGVFAEANAILTA